MILLAPVLYTFVIFELFAAFVPFPNRLRRAGGLRRWQRGDTRHLRQILVDPVLAGCYSGM